MKKVWFYWVLWAVIITIFSGLVYAAVQQNYRQNGNDPQIEIAEDTASALAQGAQLQDVIPNGNVDAAKSLAPFAIITDSSGKVLASDVVVNSSIETIPSGAYSTAKSKGENRITWQPQKGVRAAVVIVPYTAGSTSGFIAVGRSLREVEKREKTLEEMVGLGWLLSLIISFFMLWLGYYLFEKKRFADGTEAGGMPAHISHEHDHDHAAHEHHEHPHHDHPHGHPHDELPQKNEAPPAPEQNS